MNDEEKKAIERINRMLTIESTTKNIGTRVYISDLKAVLNLIEKQQKEIEELKKYKQYYEEQNEVNAKFIPESKIQDKIDEYTNLLMSCNRFSDVDRIKALNERILILKELLEFVITIVKI